MANPVGAIAHTIVVRAIDAQAEAIQLEVRGNKMEVYYQKDGAMHRLFTMPALIFPPVTTRYKLWADVDLLDRRYPLKGQFPLIYQRRHYSLDVVWEDPRHQPRVTMSIVAGAEAQVEEEAPEDLSIL